jgi:pilus assembly protein TadC
MMRRIPLMIIPVGFVEYLFGDYLGIGKFLSRLTPTLDVQLKEMGYRVDVEVYTLSSLINSIFLSFMVSLLFFGFMLTQLELASVFRYNLLVFFLFIFLFFVILMRYPKIEAGKKAENIDQILVYALRDVWLQVSSGVNLYNALLNISHSNYGVVSYEFDVTIKDVNRGLSMEKALEKMAQRNESEYLRRTLWQLINGLRTGSSVKNTLKIVITDLSRTQRRKIKDYAQELNLWTLLYMLFAVAIPSIGAALLVILSAFSGFQVTSVSFVSFLFLTVLVQFLLIGFIKSRRPLSSS